MGIDLEMFFLVKANKGREMSILEDIMKQRGIVTYKIKGNVLDVERPEATADYNALPPEESYAACLKDFNRPESIAVSSYGIFDFTVNRKFIYANMSDRWKLFFKHEPNRMHDLKDAIEAARKFTDCFYLVPDESEYHCFPGTGKVTNKDLFAVFRHPELVIVDMPKDVLQLPLEEAAKKVSYRTNNKVLQSKINGFEND